MDIDRLRALAREPDREVMPRRHGVPSMTDQVFALKQENQALRLGLNDAIAEVKYLREMVANAQEVLEGWGR